MVSDEEIADVKANLTGSLPLRLETNGGIAGNILTMVWNDLGLDYLQRFDEQVRAVSKEDILRVAQSYLDPDRYVLSIAEPDETEVGGQRSETGSQRPEVGGRRAVGAHPRGRPESRGG